MQEDAPDQDPREWHCRLARLFARSLASRYFPIALVALAILVMLPALKVGWVVDDTMHRLALLGPARVGQKLIDLFAAPTGTGHLSFAINDLYAFIRPDSNIDRFLDFGLLPWWACKGLRVSFWRPLSGVTLWVDYQLFPDSASLMHAHSILWFAAIAFLVGKFYRRFIAPVWAAGLASLLYVLDENYYFQVMLMAGRHFLLALVFGLLCLFAHRRWCRQGSLVAAGAALACFALSLLSSELGVSTFVYIFAYTLVLDDAPWLERARSLTPYLIVLLLWRFIYNGLGHGAYGSGMYLDPVHEPLRYVSAVLERGPILILGQFGGPPSLIFSFLSSPGQLLYWLVAVAFAVFVVAMFLPLVRADRTARFWFAATMLGILPVCAALPQNRTLFFVGIGAMALVAQFVAGLVRKEAWLPKFRSWRVAAWLLCIMLLLVHIGHAGIMRVALPKMLNRLCTYPEEALDMGSERDLTGRDLVVVNTPLPVVTTGLFSSGGMRALSVCRSVRGLSLALAPIKVTRTADRHLLLQAQDGSLLSTGSRQQVWLHNAFMHERFGTIFRGPGHPMKPGERVELSGLNVEVIAVDARGRPTQVLFEFPVSLDEHSFRWLCWDPTKRRFLSFEVPLVGQSVSLPGPFQ